MSERDLEHGVLLSELSDGRMVSGRIDDEQVLLVKDGDQVFAIGATCTHYSAPLADGIVTGGTIRCPWHHACFDLRTGAVLRAPALFPLPVWKTEIRDGVVFVARRREVRRVVIIGAGAAGVNVADTLRREGHRGPITLISREQDLPYDKPNLSKDFLAGKAPADWLPLHPLEYYEEQRVDLRLGVEVSSLDLESKNVVLSTGERLPWDSLVLATGCSLRKLNVPGAEHIRYLRTRRDAELIAAEAEGRRRAVVIGAGFIGLEVAASLREKGLEVVVTSPDPAPLGRIFGPEISAHIRSIHEAHGVVFRLGPTVVSVSETGLMLNDGSTIDGDLVVAGIGVAPDLELARAAGINVGDGIIVDEYLQTSARNVFACGDAASWPASDGTPLRVEHWVVAGRQGQTVARNVLGRREAFRAVPFFWSSHFEVVIGLVGNPRSWDDFEIEGSLPENDATIVYRHAGDIVAVATLGRDRVSLAAEAAMERGDRPALEALLKQPVTV